MHLNSDLLGVGFILSFLSQRIVCVYICKGGHFRAGKSDGETEWPSNKAPSKRLPLYLPMGPSQSPAWNFRVLGFAESHLNRVGTVSQNGLPCDVCLQLPQLFPSAAQSPGLRARQGLGSRAQPHTVEGKSGEAAGTPLVMGSV